MDIEKGKGWGKGGLDFSKSFGKEFWQSIHIVGCARGLAMTDDREGERAIFFDTFVLRFCCDFFSDRLSNSANILRGKWVTILWGIEEKLWVCHVPHFSTPPGCRKKFVALARTIEKSLNSFTFNELLSSWLHRLLWLLDARVATHGNHPHGHQTFFLPHFSTLSLFLPLLFFPCVSSRVASRHCSSILTLARVIPPHQNSNKCWIHRDIATIIFPLDFRTSSLFKFLTIFLEKQKKGIFTKNYENFIFRSNGTIFLVTHMAGGITSL